jgi:hypothetical protein
MADLSLKKLDNIAEINIKQYSIDTVFELIDLAKDVVGASGQVIQIIDISSALVSESENSEIIELRKQALQNNFNYLFFEFHI